MTEPPRLGVCYYPEHWSPDQWQQDAQNMRKAGLTWVRIAEFSWSRIEPARDVFDWQWLDNAIDTLASAGLQIVMCTPTATPPKWLVDEMPDMVAVDASGHPRKFGSRRHYSFSHQGYRRECRRITSLIAERYGTHPAVQAWQTDNEYGCHDTALSYCQSAGARFQQWLADRYGSIDRLNKAWGTVFWSMEFTAFSEVELPNLTVTEASPTHILDFRRFATSEIAAFNRDQVDLIHEYSPGRPVAHNFMGDFNQFDHRPVAADLAIASWDSYPIGMLQNMQHNARPDPQLEQDCLRVGDPDFQAFHHDLYRGMGRLWVMEQQPGPVNWARTNAIPARGAVRLWSWEAIAHGAETVSYFRWRQAPFAQEQMHAGLMLRNDEPAAAMKEIKMVAREIDKVDLSPTEQAEIALIHDYEADWMCEIDNQSADFYYLRLLLDVYRAARQNGGNVDVIGPQDPLDGYKLVLLPAMMCVDEKLGKRLMASGARILAGPRAGVKTTDFQIPENLSADTLSAMTGFRSERLDALPRSLPLTAKWHGITGTVSIWHERGTRTGHTSGTVGDGEPLLVSGNSAAYLTGWPDETILRALLGEQMDKAGIIRHVMPDYLRMRRRGRLVILTNYGPQSVTVPESLQGEFCVGEREIPPAGVSILQEG
ncbi:MAG: beta-galactosidase [Candidatus Puniceispirillaceae bacterium]